MAACIKLIFFISNLIGEGVVPNRAYRQQALLLTEESNKNTKVEHLDPRL